MSGNKKNRMLLSFEEIFSESISFAYKNPWWSHWWRKHQISNPFPSLKPPPEKRLWTLLQAQEVLLLQNLAKNEGNNGHESIPPWGKVNSKGDYWANKFLPEWRTNVWSRNLDYCQKGIIYHSSPNECFHCSRAVITVCLWLFWCTHWEILILLHHWVLDAGKQGW